MADTPDYDAFLADPVGAWTAGPTAIPDAWALQAARASLAFRQHLEGVVTRTVQLTGSFAEAERETRLLAEIFDAEDIAALFRELTRVRNPVEWAAEFGRRFGR